MSRLKVSARESRELEEHEQKLGEALAKVEAFNDRLQSSITSLEADIIKQQTLFVQNVKKLNSIQPATFEYDFKPSLDNIPKFETASQAAVTQYSFLYTIKTDWINFKANSEEEGYSPTWKIFTKGPNGELSHKPHGMPRQVAQGLLDYAGERIQP